MNTSTRGITAFVTLTLDAAWSAGLELHGDPRPGRVFPAEVRYLETGSGLCVGDIAWVAAGEGDAD